jgi:hypothetical protein
MRAVEEMPRDPLHSTAILAFATAVIVSLILLSGDDEKRPSHD